VTIFNSAPNLRNVELIDEGHPGAPWAARNTMCWGLYLRRLHADSILLRSPNLTKLNVDVKFTSGRLPVSSPYVRHMQLMSLTLMAFRDHAGFFAHISLPALRELHYHQCPWPRKDFIFFTSRSACSLHSLTLSSVSVIITGDDLVRCLQPMLVELNISGVDSISDMNYAVHRLTYRPSQSGYIFFLVPKLHTITFTLQTRSDSNAFMSMIESRWKADSLRIPDIIEEVHDVHWSDEYSDIPSWLQDTTQQKNAHIHLIP
jgi:hypothetical protein